uniref:HTH OST-type domain-containing protein n=1 Tax=Kryptolebias marmoratus TaxID=37003 RepID=A0A3Q3GZ51_KRYMA
KLFLFSGLNKVEYIFWSINGQNNNYINKTKCTSFRAKPNILYDVELVQSRMKQLLEKYSTGLWMSKLPEVYSQMFRQKLHPQVLLDVEKWAEICMVEKPSITNRADRLIYPPLPLKPLKSPLNNTNSSPGSHLDSTPVSSPPSTPEHKSAILPTPLAPTWTCLGSTNAPTETSSLQRDRDILPLLKVTFSSTSGSAPSSPSKPPVVMSAEVRRNIKELLSKYSQGLWAHALPKLFMDAYKMPFPEQILENLDLHKLVVLMGEMVLYYNQTGNASKAVHIQKGEVYAAKIDKNWHRVQVKAVLTNGLVNVYELDYGKHELVPITLIQPLIEEFRQLSFQAVATQLAGVTHRHWSEEASMLFRNHVEKKALVAQVESVRNVSEVKGELWERRLTVYLVDTSLEEDLWIHSIMADIEDRLSSAA